MLRSKPQVSGKLASSGRKRAASGESGFTLIEIILTVAIAAALLQIVFTGQREIRQRQQFNGSIEKAVSVINAARNEANVTVNSVGTGSGSIDEVVFAKVVEFQDDSDLMIIRTYTHDGSGTLRLRDSYQAQLPWSVQFRRTDATTTGRYLIFTRDKDTAQQYAYASPKTWTLSDVTNYSNYYPANTSLRSPVQFLITGFDTYQATITFNPADGSVTKVIR